jgi:metacaspase-1
MGYKRALIVGINYKGTSSELKGCINDANNMHALVTDHFGFTDVKVLLEQDATTSNIKDALRWLVSGCRPGDTLLFHYSGHGSQIADTSDPDVEPDKLDEIICPIDLDWKEKVITDDYMKWVFDTVPAGVNLTVFLDSCHSGSGLDQSNQYQPVVVEKGSIGGESRYLTPPPDVQALIDQLKLEPAPRAVQSRDVDTTGLLISGCRSDQTSADAYINMTYQGAATASLVKAVSTANYDITYRELVDSMNAFMVSRDFTQRPELNGSAALFDTKFLSSPVVTEEQVDAYVPVDVPPAPSTVQLPAVQQIVSGGLSRIILAALGLIAAILGIIFVVK